MIKPLQQGNPDPAWLLVLGTACSGLSACGTVTVPPTLIKNRTDGVLGVQKTNDSPLFVKQGGGAQRGKSNQQNGMGPRLPRLARAVYGRAALQGEAGLAPDRWAHGTQFVCPPASMLDTSSAFVLPFCLVLGSRVTELTGISPGPHIAISLTVKRVWSSWLYGGSGEGACGGQTEWGP